MKKILLFLFVAVVGFMGCGEKKSELVESKTDVQVPTLKKVTFYLENSESMFGYVNGNNEYIKVISELSSKSDFVSDRVVKEFFLINGKTPLSVKPLGDISSKLNSVLSVEGFNIGKTNSSELNEMLKKAMENSGNGKISIFISDGIFDINQKSGNVDKYLTLESGVTKANFIKRLSGSSSFETLLIKLNSNFNGKYFYASRSGYEKINQKRPYYIWVFGDSQLVNKYFSESFINQSLVGRTDYLRFMKLGSPLLKSRIIKGVNRKGEFDIEKDNPNIIKEAYKDKAGKFSFSFAVDFNSLPFSEVYLTDKNNFSIDNTNYEIGFIQKVNDTHRSFLPTKNKLDASHIITLICKSNKTHIGSIYVKLKYTLPKWINTSLAVETVQSPLTFGFDKLTSGISDAYIVYNQNKSLAEFKFQIKH